MLLTNQRITTLKRIIQSNLVTTGIIRYNITYVPKLNAYKITLVGSREGISGSIGDALGKIVGDLELAISKVGSAIIKAFKSVFDKVLSLAVKIVRIILKFFRLAIRYIILFLRYAYKYMSSFYRSFQRDPWHTLEFVGSIAILINNSVFP